MFNNRLNNYNRYGTVTQNISRANFRSKQFFKNCIFICTIVRHFINTSLKGRSSEAFNKLL